MKTVHTGSVNLPKRVEIKIDHKVAEAISTAYAAGEIVIRQVKRYLDQDPPPGYEWWWINWVRQVKGAGGVMFDSIMYNNGYKLKTAVKKEFLKDHDKLIGFLLRELTVDMQIDERAMKTVKRIEL